MAQQHGLFLAYDEDRDSPLAQTIAAVRESPRLSGLGWTEGAIHYMLRISEGDAFKCPGFDDPCEACASLTNAREPGQEG